MTTTTYTIAGCKLPLGTDDVIDYLAQYGEVDPSYGKGCVALLWNAPDNEGMPAVFASVSLLVYSRGGIRGTLAGRCVCWWEEEREHGTTHCCKSFDDLADGVAFFLARKAGVPLSPSTEKIA